MGPRAKPGNSQAGSLRTSRWEYFVPSRLSTIRISIWPVGRFLIWSSRARVSLISLSLPVPVSTYFVEKMPVLRTERLRRFVATRDEAFRNHCAVFSSETFIIILVSGPNDTSSANACADLLQLREHLEGEQESRLRAPRAVCSTLCKARIGEGCELVENDRAHRLIRLTLDSGSLRVSLANHQLNVLQEDFAERLDGASFACWYSTTPTE